MADPRHVWIWLKNSKFQKPGGEKFKFWLRNFLHRKKNKVFASSCLCLMRLRWLSALKITYCMRTTWRPLSISPFAHSPKRNPFSIAKASGLLSPPRRPKGWLFEWLDQLQSGGDALAPQSCWPAAYWPAPSVLCRHAMLIDSDAVRNCVFSACFTRDY